MFLDLWWLYVVGGVVVCFVIFQAWDRRHNSAKFTRQENERIDAQSALDALHDEAAKRSWPSTKV